MPANALVHMYLQSCCTTSSFSLVGDNRAIPLGQSKMVLFTPTCDVSKAPGLHFSCYPNKKHHTKLAIRVSICLWRWFLGSPNLASCFTGKTLAMG